MDRLTLFAVVGAGLVIRASNVGAGEFSGDEAFSWAIVQYPVGEMLSKLTDDVHPPLYYMILKFWCVFFGHNVLAMRSMSVVLGSLSIALLYGFVDRVAGVADRGIGRGAAILASILLASSPFQVVQSRSVRMYSLGVALAIASSWTLVVASRGKTRVPWVAYVVLASLFSYTHYYAIFVIAAHAIYAAASLKICDRPKCPARAAILWRLAPWMAVALMYAPWLGVQAHQVSVISKGYWIPPVTLGQVTTTLTYFTLGVHEATPTWRFGALAWLIWLAVLVAILASRALDDVYMALLAYAPVALSLAISMVGPPIFFERYLVFAHVFFLGSLALASARLLDRPRFAVMMAALAFNNAFALTFEAGYVTRDGGSIRLVCSLLKERSSPGDVVVVREAGLFNQMWHSCQSMAIPVRLRLMDDPGSAGLHRANAASIPPSMIESEAEIEAMKPSFFLVSKEEDPKIPIHWSRLDRWVVVDRGLVGVLQRMSIIDSRPHGHPVGGPARWSSAPP